MKAEKKRWTENFVLGIAVLVVALCAGQQSAQPQLRLLLRCGSPPHTGYGRCGHRFLRRSRSGKRDNMPVADLYYLQEMR